MSEVELVNVSRLSDSPSTGPPDRLDGSSINGDLPRTDDDHEATTKLVYLDKEGVGSGAPEVSVHYSKSVHSPERDEECDGEADRLLHEGVGEMEKEDESEVEDDQKALIYKPEGGEIEKEEGEERDTGDKKYTSSLAGASMNFINSIIGSGIIGIPSALRQSGFLTGTVLLVLVAIITDYTVILLIKDAFLANKFSYQEMVTAAFGRPGYWYLTFAQFFFPFFAMTGYVVIVGDTFSRLLDQIAFLLHHELPPALAEPRSIIIKITAVILVMMPLSMLRRISRLEKISGFAILCIVFIVTVTVYEVFNLYCSVRCFTPTCCDSLVTSWIINSEFIEAVGIYAAAFVCHHNTYLIYGSLRRRSLTRFSIVSHVSVSASFVFCIVLGLAGFLTILGETQGDLLNNYCKIDPVANATRFFFACVVMLTYPIECFVAREVVEISLARIPYRAISWIPVPPIRKAINHLLYTPRHESLIRHVILTLLLVGATLAIGISTNDLEIVLTFNGCFTAIPLAFILPTASYLKLSKTKWCSRGKLVALAVLILGVIVMFIGTGLAIKKVVDSYSHFDCYSPKYCHVSNASHEGVCCHLHNSTNSFNLTVPLCDCSRLCPDTSILSQLSDDYCYNVDGNYETCENGF